MAKTGVSFLLAIFIAAIIALIIIGMSGNIITGLVVGAICGIGSYFALWFLLTVILNSNSDKKNDDYVLYNEYGMMTDSSGNIIDQSNQNPQDVSDINLFDTNIDY